MAPQGTDWKNPEQTILRMRHALRFIPVLKLRRKERNPSEPTIDLARTAIAHSLLDSLQGEDMGNVGERGVDALIIRRGVIPYPAFPREDQGIEGAPASFGPYKHDSVVFMGSRKVPVDTKYALRLKSKCPSPRVAKLNYAHVLRGSFRLHSLTRPEMDQSARFASHVLVDDLLGRDVDPQMRNGFDRATTMTMKAIERAAAA